MINQVKKLNNNIFSQIALFLLLGMYSYKNENEAKVDMLFLEFEKYELENGLQVVLYQDK